jgi:nitric oxide dioxygenase
VAAGSRFDVHLLHADRDEQSFALRRQVLADVRALPHATMNVWYQDGEEGSLPVDGRFAGAMDVTDVDLPDDATYYLCGPLPFMQAVRESLLARGIEARDIQYEVFGPDLWQADAD